jgi:hypothetical protein
LWYNIWCMLKEYNIDILKINNKALFYRLSIL